MATSSEMETTQAKANVLSPGAIESLRSYAEEVWYPEREVIVRRGDPGSAFYIVLAGQVEITLRRDNHRLSLARMGPGASFGEMSLLASVPVSADAVTVTDTTVLEIRAGRFHDAMAASAPLRNHVLYRLCDSLRRTSSEAWDLFQQTQALTSLMHTEDSDEPIVAESAAMARLQKRMDNVSRQKSPILIVGEAGVGKFFAARKIHRAATELEAPLIILDCQQTSENTAGTILFGTQQVPQFTSRDCHSGDSHLQVRGALHLADGGTIVLRHIECLDTVAQETLCLYLDALCDTEDIFPDVCVIGTTKQDLELLAESGVFHRPLAKHFASNAVEMPPLRRRKRDILPLARHFLSVSGAKNDKSSYHFTESAERSLLSARYQHSNVAELREAVELASVFAEDTQVDAEHIFTGPKSQGHPLEYDLTSTGFVQWLLRRPSLVLLQGTLLLLFSTIIVSCLLAGPTVTGRIANTLVWAAWWPGLLLLFLFVGRLWCTVCPIAAMGRIARLAGSLKRSPPSWIKNNNGWVMASLFVAIIWAEHVFHMTETPFATAILLLSLMLMPIVFCLIFQRELWCRYLCPLGSLAASYSVCSTVQVHANPDICSSQCTTHDCFKGSATERACPVYHHPLYARDAHNCKLCLTCLRSCPHQSARIYLHPPLQRLWRLAELGKELVPFVLTVFLLTLVMLSSQTLRWIGTSGGFTLLVLAAVALAFALKLGLGRLFANDKDPALLCRIAFGMLVLAWGPFMAFHLGNIPELDAVLVQAADGSVLAPILNASPINILTILQFSAVAFAASCAAICFWRVRVRQRSLDGRVRLWPWGFVAVVCVAYLSVAITLVICRGILI